MTAASLYKTEKEKQQHLSTISMLAHELEVPENSMKQLYEEELCVLQEHARIRIYLSVLVSRKIKEKLTGKTPKSLFKVGD